VIGWTVSRKGYSTAWTLSCSTPKVEKNIPLDKNQSRFIYLCPKHFELAVGKLKPDENKPRNFRSLSKI